MNTENLISLHPGSVIAGRFEVVKCLGSGSMGLVYACRDRELSGRTVAVKVLYPEVALDAVAVARFRNEIFSSYGVSHPNVIRSFEFVRDGDLIAYTMEYVEGGVLLDYIEAKQRQPIQDVVRLMIEMCSGVQAIHDAGIVHRDLKPENILITRDGSVKIADFGIARTDHGPKLTEHGGVIGTIDYVAPEYMMESKVDWRSDIYALGVLSYELITGQSPFKADSIVAAMTMRINTDPAVPSTLRADCPQELDRIIMLAMARNPEQRYQSAAEMGKDLVLIYKGRNLLKSSAVMNLTLEKGTKYQGPVHSLSEGTSVIESPSGKAGGSSSRTEVDTAKTAEFRLSPGGLEKSNNKPIVTFGQKPSSSESESDVTQTLAPEIVDIASFYQANHPQLESVISRSAPVFSSGGGKRISGEVVTNSSGINRQRIQKLKTHSAKVQKFNAFDKLFWIAVFVVAVVSGVAGAFYIVDRFVKPVSVPASIIAPEVGNVQAVTKPETGKTVKPKTLKGKK